MFFLLDKFDNNINNKKPLFFLFSFYCILLLLLSFHFLISYLLLSFAFCSFIQTTFFFVPTIHYFIFRLQMELPIVSFFKLRFANFETWTQNLDTIVFIIFFILFMLKFLFIIFNSLIFVLRICECAVVSILLHLKITYEMNIVLLLYIQLQFDETKHKFIALTQEFLDSFINVSFFSLSLFFQNAFG